MGGCWRQRYTDRRQRQIDQRRRLIDQRQRRETYSQRQGHIHTVYRPDTCCTHCTVDQRHAGNRDIQPDWDTYRPEKETYRPVAESYNPATKAFCTTDQSHVNQSQRTYTGTYIETQRQLLVFVHVYMEEKGSNTDTLFRMRQNRRIQSRKSIYCTKQSCQAAEISAA